MNRLLIRCSVYFLTFSVLSVYHTITVSQYFVWSLYVQYLRHCVRASILETSCRYTMSFSSVRISESLCWDFRRFLLHTWYDPRSNWQSVTIYLEKLRLVFDKWRKSEFSLSRLLYRTLLSDLIYVSQFVRQESYPTWLSSTKKTVFSSTLVDISS